MSSSSIVIPPVTYSSIRSQLRTGDVITFEGVAPVDRMIDLMQEGVYSHVGLILRPSQDELYFFDAPGETDTLPDPLRNNQPSPGVRAADLDTLLAEYMTSMHLTQFTWRPLTPALTPAQVTTFLSFAREVDGTLFPGTKANIPPLIQALLTRLIGSELLADINVGLLISYLNGTVLQTNEPGSFFCAQLAAQTYMQLGLLPTSPWPANSYGPSNFDDEPTPMQLQNGYTLNTPVIVNWNKTST